MMTPNEADIIAVMAETRMERMQAINHLRQRAMLQTLPDRRFTDAHVIRFTPSMGRAVSNQVEGAL